MSELDTFERSLETAFGALADRSDTRIDVVAFTDRVAGRSRPRRAWLAGRGTPDRLVAVPAIAWLLLLIGLLVGLVVGGVATGSWLAADGTILATTRAAPLPAQATCQPGGDPDAPGPAGQARPSAVDSSAMAFDRHAGRIVLASDDGTWTFDVCTNTWQRMNPAQDPGADPEDRPDWLVYDADSDRTVAFTTSGQFWSYDLASDRWTKAGRYPEIRRGYGWGSWHTGAVYHEPSGLVVVYDGATMWAYDVESRSLTEVAQRPDPTRPHGAGVPADPRADVIERLHYDPSGGVAIGYDPRIDRLVALVRPARPGGPSEPRPRDETWTFDPDRGGWRLVTSAETRGVPTIVPWAFALDGAGSPAAYDEMSGLVLFRLGQQLVPFDAGRGGWVDERFRIGSSEQAVRWCADTPVHDPLNGRLVCLGGAWYPGVGPEDRSGVSALSTDTGTWRWLLEPLPTADTTR